MRNRQGVWSLGGWLERSWGRTALRSSPARPCSLSSTEHSLHKRPVAPVPLRNESKDSQAFLFWASFFLSKESGMDSTSDWLQPGETRQEPGHPKPYV